MEQTKNPTEFLQAFITLLETEKEALIHNKGEMIQELVSKKQLFVDAFPGCDFSVVDANEVKTLVEMIRQLQETNLILTQQALDYQNTILEALSKGANKAGKTYSKSGQQTGLTEASILNQSL